MSYEIYHDSYTGAIQEVEKFVGAQGYNLDPEEMCDVVGFGPAKPNAGMTNRFSVCLYKKALCKKQVHFQVYGIGRTEFMSADRYELNVYIS